MQEETLSLPPLWIIAKPNKAVKTAFPDFNSCRNIYLLPATTPTVILLNQKKRAIFGDSWNRAAQCEHSEVPFTPKLTYILRFFFKVAISTMCSSVSHFDTDSYVNLVHQSLIPTSSKHWVRCHNHSKHCKLPDNLFTKTDLYFHISSKTSYAPEYGSESIRTFHWT